jgi:hypothetical protein
MQAQRQGEKYPNSTLLKSSKDLGAGRQKHGREFSLFNARISELIFDPSPEPSGPIRQIVFGLTLEVGEYRKHAGGSFPGDLTLHV